MTLPREEVLGSLACPSDRSLAESCPAVFELLKLRYARGLTLRSLGRRRCVRRSAADQHFAREEYEGKWTAADALPHTRWDDRYAQYQTSVSLKGMQVTLTSRSFAEAEEASRIAQAAADACDSHHARRKRKADWLQAHAAERASNLARYGDTCAKERRLLLDLRDKLAALGHGKLQIYVLPDGAHADALYRTDDMPEDAWLQWQHKTCAQLTSQYDKRCGLAYERWDFRHMNGYAGMIIVCQCELDGKLWLLDGAQYASHKGTVAIYWVKKTQAPSRQPVSLEELCASLLQNCTTAATRLPEAMPTVTRRDAELSLGRTQAVERVGILAFVEHILGGEPLNREEMEAARIRLPESMRQATDAEPLVLRVTRAGALFRYPVDQNRKVDLEVWSESAIIVDGVTMHSGGCCWQRLQFKTARLHSGQNRLQVSLSSTAGAKAKVGWRSPQHMPRASDTIFIEAYRLNQTISGLD